MPTNARVADAPLAEFTVKAVVAGVVLGIIFGAANAYLGLRVGLTVSASIPAAVMTVALFRLFRARGTILEANLSQTIGSASTSLASGTIFTIPALFMWNMAPPYLQVVVLAYLGAILGLAAMIPLRRLLIVQSHDELPFPEGKACAEVLRATVGGSSASAWIFRGIALGAAVKLAVSLLFLTPGNVHALLPVVPKAELALELAPALLGVGFILGYKQSGVLVAGSLLSAVVLTPIIALTGAALVAPLAPEPTRLVADMTANEIWARYVRYVGAGAVAAGGIITVLRALPTMASAFLAVTHGMTRRGSQADAARTPETDRDLPPLFVIGAIVLVVAIPALVPGVFAGNMSPLQRAVCAAGVGLFGVLFVAVAARIVGIVGVSSQPTSGITLITLLGVASIFAAAGWTDPAAPRSGSDRRNNRGGCRIEGRRHLAGSEDRLSRRCDPGTATVRPAYRRVFRLLGRGRNRDPARLGLHIRFARHPGTAGDVDENHHRRRARRGVAVGPRAVGRGTLDRGAAVQRVAAGLCDRRLPAARNHGRHFPGRMLTGADRARKQAGRDRGRRRPRHSRGVRARRG